MSDKPENKIEESSLTGRFVTKNAGSSGGATVISDAAARARAKVIVNRFRDAHDAAYVRLAKR